MTSTRAGAISGAWLLLAALSCFWPSARVTAETLDGKSLFHDSHKGNCAACHRWSADSTVGSVASIGPSLVGIKTRYPDREKLREIIRDARNIAPDTIMPPYGKNRILTEAEIDAVARYVESL